jgi:hypothetical protein
MIDLWIDHKGIIHASESNTETLCEKSLGDMGLAMHSIKPTCSHCLYVLDVRKVRAEMAADIAKAKSEGGDAFDPLPSPLLQKGEGNVKYDEVFVEGGFAFSEPKTKESFSDTDLLEPYRIGRGAIEEWAANLRKLHNGKTYLSKEPETKTLEEIEREGLYRELIETMSEPSKLGAVFNKVSKWHAKKRGLSEKLEQIDNHTFNEFPNDLKVKIPKRYKDMKDLRTNLRVLFQLMTDELEVGREVKVDLGGFEYGISLDPSLAKREEKAAG